MEFGIPPSSPEALPMNVVLVIFMVVLIFPIQVFAEEGQKCGTPVDAICEVKSSDYSDFNFSCLLVDEPSKFDRNKAFLAVDDSGKPAVYPLFERQHRCVMLSQHSLTDILAHWIPAKVEGDIYSFCFFCWANKTWSPVRVDLQFRENYCSRFRVVSDNIKVQSWLPVEAIPIEADRPATNGTLKLPLFMGLVEGPRDMPDCSIRPIPDGYRNALEQGKCPLGFSTQTSSKGL